MLSDWRLIASRIEQSLKDSSFVDTESDLLRDIIISNRKLHINPEPQWSNLAEIPLNNNMVYKVEPGQLYSSYSQKFSEIIKLLQYIAALITTLLFNPKAKSLGENPLTLFYSDGFDYEKRLLFSDFISESRFNDFTLNRILLVQDRNIWKKKEINGKLFVKDIGFYLASNSLNLPEKFNLLIKIFNSATSIRNLKNFGYLGAYKIRAENVLWTFLFARVSDLKLIATNSYMELLPTSFYSASYFSIRRYMIWYSNNNFPVPSLEGGDKVDNRIDFACRTNIDTHLVWTTDFGKNISLRNQKVEIQIVGSIMMYPRKKILPLDGKFKVIVFDMTPWEGYPLQMYGSELFMASFLEDIVKVCADLPECRIFLKPKRNFVRTGKRYIHSKSYLKLIDSLENDQKITVLNPRTNIYGLVDQANIILGFPFASPVLIGGELLKPSFYYNPEFSLNWPLRDSMDQIKVISGRSNLSSKVWEIYALKP